MTDYLILFNSVTNLLLIGFLFWQLYLSQFEFEWEETFWMKRKYGLVLRRWNPNQTFGTKVFRLRFRNREKLTDGEYEEYRQARKEQESRGGREPQ